MLSKSQAWVLAVCFLWACDDFEVGQPCLQPELAGFELKVCPSGEVTPGIDVSKWQGDINWSKVAGAGIRFAYIRVSDGLEYPDPKFKYNWKEAKSAGVVRGAYQYFEPGQDAVEQAWYLLEEMGPLEEGDLPPALDLETMDGQSAAKVIDQVDIWIDVVEGVLGVEPLIYTSAGFWGGIGSSKFAGYPLWVANWEANCPLMPVSWNQWVFWQTSDFGSVAGISEAVDLDLFNGNLDALHDFAVGGPTEPLPEEVTCPVAAVGTTIVEEDGPCGKLPSLGNQDGYNDMDGHGGHAWWVSMSIPDPDYGKGVNWMLDFQAAGTYELEAQIPAGLDNLSSMATYKVFHPTGPTKVLVDQSAAAGGWAYIGSFQFIAGHQDQWVRLGDNYKPEEGPGRQLALDALRVKNNSGCECTVEGELEFLPCDGGTQQRECDGCDWSEWSACDVDEDGDGTEDELDNCPGVPNPYQEDTDGDAWPLRNGERRWLTS